MKLLQTNLSTKAQHLSLKMLRRRMAISQRPPHMEEQFTPTVRLIFYGVPYGSSLWFSWHVWPSGTSPKLCRNLAFPVGTTVELTDQASIPFPTVTLCNRNPIDCSKLAFAYIRNPAKIRELMTLSNCKDTLSTSPLNRMLVSSVQTLYTRSAQKIGKAYYPKWCIGLIRFS